MGKIAVAGGGEASPMLVALARGGTAMPAMVASARWEGGRALPIGASMDASAIGARVASCSTQQKDEEVPSWNASPPERP